MKHISKIYIILLIMLSGLFLTSGTSNTCHCGFELSRYFVKYDSKKRTFIPCKFDIESKQILLNVIQCIKEEDRLSVRLVVSDDVFLPGTKTEKKPVKYYVMNCEKKGKKNEYKTIDTLLTAYLGDTMALNINCNTTKHIIFSCPTINSFMTPLK